MANNEKQSDSVLIDRLAFSRAQHLQARDNRSRINSDVDDETEPISDWSESDRECCPLSDFELGSNLDEFKDKSVPPSNHFLEQVLRIENEPTNKTTRKTFQPAPLLPARRRHHQTKTNNLTRSNLFNNQVILSSSQSSRSRKLTSFNHSNRSQMSRETTSISINSTATRRKDSSISFNSSCPSTDDHGQQSQSLNDSSPISSHVGLNQNMVPRVYELKKIFVDDTDYGRLTDVSTSKQTQLARNRQKWGTIVHPPFPLGYQQISADQLTQLVERLSSPNRPKDRRTPIQTPSKRFLSVEQTDALVCIFTQTHTYTDLFKEHHRPFLFYFQR